MVKTPQTYTFVLTAGQRTPPVRISGRWVEIIACTADSVLVGFDGDTPEEMRPGRGYPCPDGGFRSIVLQDASGAGCTVTVVISAEPLSAGATNQQVGNTIIPITDKLLAATGAPGTLICAARANRKRIVIVGDYTMTGVAFIGKDATVSAVNKAGPVTQYGAWQEQYTGPVYGVGSDALQIVCGYELV